VYYKPDHLGGWQGPAHWEPLPTSLEEAMDDNFYYIFDSYYPVKGGSGFMGDLVGLEDDSFTGAIYRFCRLQLGGYIWQDNEGSALVKLALTHGRTDKAQPAGPWPEPPSNECSNIELEFDNGVIVPDYPASSAGAWVAEASATQVNTGSFNIEFHNVQMDPLGSGFPYCSNTWGGTGGDINKTYNKNPIGSRIDFHFNTTVQVPGSFLSCSLDGTVYSVGVDQGHVLMPNPADRTPGTSHPSPLARGVVDYLLY
jgi:hypothetical protein